MAWAQIAQAGLALAGNLFGASSTNKAAAKAAQVAANENLKAAQQAKDLQAQLSEQQNVEVRHVNTLVTSHNDQERQMALATAGAATNTTNRIDFDALVRDSEAAGFNPLTVLRLGGLAGYSSTSVSGGQYNPSYMTYQQFGEIPGGPVNNPVAAAPVVDGWSSGINAALGAWNAYDPYKAERGQLELGLARAQIANLGSDTAANNRRLAIPTWTGSGFKTTVGGFGGMVQSALASTAAAGNKALGQPTTWEAGDVKVTNPLPYKAGPVNPNFADASSYEDRYGELGGSVLGIGNMIADAHSFITSEAMIKRYQEIRKSWTMQNIMAEGRAYAQQQMPRY